MAAGEMWYNKRHKKSAMPQIPQTSKTLLSDLKRDAQHARWSEFVARYRPMMLAFLRKDFPSVDADEVVQETLVAIIHQMPVYHYVPEEKGHFHNYLIGILRHKALRELSHAKRQSNLCETLAKDAAAQSDCANDEEIQAWHKAIFEIALEQYLADDTVQARTKQIFVRLAVNGESPERVAAAFGLKRNAVDQIKNRAMMRLRTLVQALEKAGDDAL